MHSSSTKEHLISAYHHMMERVKQALDTAEHKAIPSLEHAIHKARETAVALGELSRDEAERVGEYLKRDIHDFAEHLNKTSSEYRSWFHMDLELIEVKLLDLMTQVADKTRLELTKLATEARAPRLYNTGEISGPGSLQCCSCGETLQFTKAEHIPLCPQCHATEFIRLTHPQQPANE
jgi:predicted RNA-binding Zn-ribbon protein involved in translation (DUF1610 family)